MKLLFLRFILVTYNNINIAQSTSAVNIKIFPGTYMCSVRSRARFREFVHTLGRVVAKRTHQRVCAIATRRNTQNGLKKFVNNRKRRRNISS